MINNFQINFLLFKMHQTKLTLRTRELPNDMEKAL